MIGSNQRIAPVMENGNVYKVQEDISRFVYKGLVLKECTDGWYQAFDKDRKKLHFRVGKRIIEENKDKLSITL